jgi:hypothetical protein
MFMTVKHSSSRRQHIGKLAAFVLLAGGVIGTTAAIASSSLAAPESPVASLVKLGIKFDGAKTCNASACHGGNEPGESPHGNNAYTLWSGKDPHRAAYDVLANDDSKKIAAAAGIADATTSADCLSCHATNAPENLQGKEFAVDEGNSCTTCHGPSDKYLQPHATKGWTEQQRKAAGAPDAAYHAKLLTATGLYDTNPLVERADRCGSCHLAIDHKLVKAGHPVTIFEMDYYSNPNVYLDRHWPDGKEPYFNTHQWAAGQIVGVRDAFRQLASRASGGADAEAVKQAYEQAMGHLMVLKAFVAAGGPGAAVVTAGEAVKLGDNAALATAATATATAAEAAYPAFNTFKGTKDITVKTMNTIVNDAALTGLGIHGVEQQAYGVFALYNAFVVSEKPGDADSVNESIGKLFGPLDKAAYGNMDGYADALKEVAGKLPK